MARRRPDRVRTARDGEALAAAHLERSGLRILARNWRAGRRELDLVALDGDVVAFVEVKTRTGAPAADPRTGAPAPGLRTDATAAGGRIGAAAPPPPPDPLEGLTRAKRRDLRRAAEQWIHAHPGIGREFRFDAVSVVVVPGGEPRIEHLRGAFYGEDV